MQEASLIYNEKNILFTCKAIAILSIVSAHVAGTGSQTSVEMFCSRVLSAWGTVGVPVFFIISGYLYERSLSRHGCWAVFTGKFKSLLLPWLFCGTIVWLYVVLRKGEITLQKWFFFLIGEYSYLYFMTVLLALFVLYMVLRKNVILIYIGLVVWLIANIIIYFVGWNLPFSPYLNIFTWQGWFLAGGLVQMKGLQIKITKIVKIVWIPCLIAGCMLIVWSSACGNTITYWSSIYLIMEILLLPSMYGFAILILRSKKLRDLAVDVGERSFSLYLLHMPIAGIIAYIMNRFPNGVFILLRPLLTVAVTYIGIYVMGRICAALRVGHVYNLMIGKREK